MVTSIIGILVFLIFTIMIHLGPYPTISAPSRKLARTISEVGIIVGCLLVVPFIRCNLFWFSGWLGAYLVLGISAPILLEWIVCKRSLSVIGFQMPVNRSVLAIVSVILGIYLVSRLVQPDFINSFEWRRFISNSVLFALLEETLFRGMIQTRLESVLGVICAWMVTGAFFGFYHFYVHYLVPGRMPTIEDGLALIFLTSLGFLLGVVFAKTRSLLPSFLIHAVNNL